MLSRIIPREQAEEPEPILWAPLGVGGTELSHTGEPRRPNAGVPQEDAVRLQARIGELERLMEQRVREAHSQGFQEGRGAGRNEALAEVQPVLEKLGRTIHDLAGLRPKLRLQAESDLVRLAVAIARRILNREMSVDTQAIAALVGAGLQTLNAQEVCRIRVHPEHQQPLEASLRALGTRTPIEVVADPGLDRGGAVLETKRGDLDISVETQLKEIERGLTDRLRGRS